MELDKSIWQVALVKLTCHPRLRPLFKSLDKWQLVKSTCQVNLRGDPPKITPASCPKTPPWGALGEGSGHGHGQKKVKIDHFFYFFRFWPFRQFFALNMMFLEIFLDVLNTRGHTRTWQCCCGVGVVSATICGQNVRWDMSVTAKCVLLPLHSHVLLTHIFSLFVYPNFLCTTCVASWLCVSWKRCGRGFMWPSYFTSCPSENTFFRQSTTRKKRTEKSRKHLVRRDSDSEKNICRRQNFFRRWQIPLAVTSSTWQTSQLDKLTWQVDLRLALLLLFKSLDQL